MKVLPLLVLCASPLVPLMSYGQALTVDSSGNVGIGTTTPATTLHVSSPSPLAITTTGTASSGPSGLFSLRNNATTTGWNFGIEPGTGWASGAPGTFYIDKNSVGPQLAITPSGNVGIGTVTPTAKLEVAGSAKVGSLIVGSSTILSQGYFESSGYGLPGSGNTLAISHGMGGLPRFYSVSLRCVNSSFGWQAGDEIHLDSVHMRSTNAGCTVGVNASQFKVKQLGDISIHRIDNNNIGVLDGNWQIVFRAWR